MKLPISPDLCTNWLRR